MRNIKIINRKVDIKLIALFVITLLYTFTGCVRDQGNMPPIMQSVEKDISIEMGDSVTVGLEHITGFDQDGDNISIYLHAGESFSLNGTTVIPDSGFIGDIKLLVQLFDGVNYSNIDTITISVVKNIVVMPFYKGSWWSYNDTIPASDTVLTSRLEVSDTTMEITIDTVTKVAYK